jgi:hypothetical protein
VNTYDPADRIVYLHIGVKTDRYALPVAGIRTRGGLPSGSAKESPRTRIARP